LHLVTLKKDRPLYLKSLLEQLFLLTLILLKSVVSGEKVCVEGSRSLLN